MKGEDFSDKHWFDTFNLLGIEIKPVDQLTVHDLFKQSKNIETFSKELQVKGHKLINSQKMRSMNQYFGGQSLMSRISDIFPKTSSSLILKSHVEA